MLLLFPCFEDFVSKSNQLVLFNNRNLFSLDSVVKKKILPDKMIFSIPLEKNPIGNKKGWISGYINLYYLDFNTCT